MHNERKEEKALHTDYFHICCLYYRPCGWPEPLEAGKFNKNILAPVWDMPQGQ